MCHLGDSGTPESGVSDQDVDGNSVGYLTVDEDDLNDSRNNLKKGEGSPGPFVVD